MSSCVVRRFNWFLLNLFPMKLLTLRHKKHSLTNNFGHDFVSLKICFYDKIEFFIPKKIEWHNYKDNSTMFSSTMFLCHKNKIFRDETFHP